MMKKHFLLSTAIACASFGFSTSGLQAQTVKLFNGKDLSNWNLVVKNGNVAAQEVFMVKNGVIHVTGNPIGYMYTKEKYADFTLHLEWRYPKKPSNSGIFLFMQDGEKIWPNAIQCQLKAGEAGDLIIMQGSDLVEYMCRPGEKRPTAPVLPKANASSEKPVGEWNCTNITCKNGTITIFVNGVYQNTGSRSLYKSGYIGMQSEGNEIEFRNITITRK